MKYPSKKDAWLTIVIWGSILVTLLPGVLMLNEGAGKAASILVFSTTFLMSGLVLWFWVGTYYVLEKDTLIVKYGPIRKQIPLQSISSVKKTSNPLSSPALSMKRLEISYGKYDSVLISPEDRDEFMKILAERCPQATIKFD